jgi:short-subunit dehydrogenase
MRLQGKVALVTGASRGVGRAIAVALGQRDTRLALVARSRAALEAVARRIGPERALAVVADLADPAAIGAAVDAALARFGHIDILVNNAGVLSGRDFLETDPRELAYTVDVNFRAAVVLTRLVAARMAARRTGHIVTVSSLAGVAGLPGDATYAGTKAALRLWMASLRPELEPVGIRLTDVVLGFVRTDMLARAEGNPRVRRLHLLEDVPPERVAAAVVRAIARREDVVVLPARSRYFLPPAEGPARTLMRLLARA